MKKDLAITELPGIPEVSRKLTIVPLVVQQNISIYPENLTKFVVRCDGKRWRQIYLKIYVNLYVRCDEKDGDKEKRNSLFLEFFKLYNIIYI